MKPLSFWLGIVAIALGAYAMVDGFSQGRGFDSTGLIAIAVGLVAISVSRRRADPDAGE